MVVEIERHGDIAVLYLNDLRRKNALSTALVDALIAAFEDSRAGDDPARAIVISNCGDDFCAGADINDMLATGWLDNSVGVRTPVDLFKVIDSDPRPVIAAVQGLVLGGGVELTSVCDLVIAETATTFRLPEIALGVLPNTALARLPAMIGMRRAAELILTRRVWTADEARACGFVTSVVSREDLVPAAIKLAGSIVRGAPPTVIAGVKAALRADDWAKADGFLELMDSAEWREGTSAFAEKRKPDYERFWRNT
jgi:enoyl-CoA hydratase/carnithine racemase